MPVGDARDHFSELIAEVERPHQRVTLRHGRLVAVFISPEDLESLEETLDIPSQPGALDKDPEIRSGYRSGAHGEHRGVAPRWLAVTGVSPGWGEYLGFTRGAACPTASQANFALRNHTTMVAENPLSRMNYRALKRTYGYLW